MLGGDDEALKLPMTHKKKRQPFRYRMSKQITENIPRDIKHNIFWLEGKMEKRRSEKSI